MTDINQPTTQTNQQVLEIKKNKERLSNLPKKIEDEIINVCLNQFHICPRCLIFLFAFGVNQQGKTFNHFSENSTSYYNPVCEMSESELNDNFFNEYYKQKNVDQSTENDKNPQIHHLCPTCLGALQESTFSNQIPQLFEKHILSPYDLFNPQNAEILWNHVFRIRLGISFGKTIFAFFPFLKLYLLEKIISIQNFPQKSLSKTEGIVPIFCPSNPKELEKLHENYRSFLKLIYSTYVLPKYCFKKKTDLAAPGIEPTTSPNLNIICDQRAPDDEGIHFDFFLNLSMTNLFSDSLQEEEEKEEEDEDDPDNLLPQHKRRKTLREKVFQKIEKNSQKKNKQKSKKETHMQELELSFKIFDRLLNSHVFKNLSDNKPIENTKKRLSKQEIALKLQEDQEFEFWNKLFNYFIAKCEASNSSFNPKLKIMGDGKARNFYIIGTYKKFQRYLPHASGYLLKKTEENSDDVSEGSEMAEVWFGPSMKTSVEELIITPIREFFGSERINFVSSGREDVDVRMLGTGRPFLLEIEDPTRNLSTALKTHFEKIPTSGNLSKFKNNSGNNTLPYVWPEFEVVSKSNCKLSDVEKTINDPKIQFSQVSEKIRFENSASDLLKELNFEFEVKSSFPWVEITELSIGTKAEADKLKKTIEEKKKTYSALVAINRILPDSVLETFNTKFSKTACEISQGTPIRVVHRRTNMFRSRAIHWMKLSKHPQCETIVCEKKSFFYVLDLNTSSGTYIKEFVSSDFGRTTPSLVSILEEILSEIEGSTKTPIECDVQLLDVTGVEFL